jgi:ABC-type transport system substrate-binding protein
MPGVASSWEQIDDITWSFTLREGLTFHDGTPLTAADVEYSWKANRVAYGTLDNTSDPAWSQLYNFSYASDDALTFEMSSSWHLPDPTFELDFSGINDLLCLVPEGSYDTEQQQEDFTRNPISCGPYMVDEWAAQDYVRLKRFDDWFGWGLSFTASNGETFTFPTKDDAFEFVKFRFIDEKAMALVELRTGGVDLTTGQFSSKDAFDLITATEGFDGYIMSRLGGASMNFNIQGDWPTYYGGPGNFPVSQPWFRKAISHAVNRTNIVDNVYLGMGEERDTVFADWILTNFPDIDTSGFYDMSTDIAKAEAILDAQGYEALGFADEPDNRFGWGTYANETAINGIEQTKGRHFLITTMDCDFCVKRVLSLKNDLKEIGIYVDTEINEFGTYLDKIYGGTPGYLYNTSYVALNQKDPDYFGGSWDFAVGGFGGNYESPWDFIAYRTSYYWYWWGYSMYSWYNEQYEEGYAKTNGGTPLMGPDPADMPEGGYPAPEWNNDDAQFVEGCTLAADAISDELPFVPLIWYVNAYAFNDRLQGFLGQRNSRYMIAYCYWE